MKLLFTCFALLLLSGCQTTSLRNQSGNQALLLLSEEAENSSADQEEGLSHLLDDKTDTSCKEIVLPTEYKNVWLKLAEGFTFEVPDNSRVRAQRNYFIKHPKYLQRVAKRAEPFLYLIVKQLEDQNLPLELALLPIVESAFDPFAYSYKSASGLWQFMPVTADRFGLKQDFWYDGRRDVYASTVAALRYMGILYDYLDQNWLHAVAAYNSGEGRVKRSVRRNSRNNKPTDFWNLSLPKETKNYVPKLLALVDLFRNHKKYGIELPVLANKPVLTYVDTGSQLDLAYAAKLADLTIAEIQLLNPAFNQWATSPTGPHKLLIPSVSADSFLIKLSAIDKNKLIKWDRYKVKSGDSLSVVAKRFKTTTSTLKEINDLNNSVIRIGQALLIPVASRSKQAYVYSQAQRFKHKLVANGKGRDKITHIVTEGDTLWDISRQYKVTSKEIAKWNSTNTRKALQLGQKLTIWKKAKQYSQKQSTRRVTYKVRNGDSLYLIGKKFNVKTRDLERWNKLRGKKYIQPGQSIIVYVNVRKFRS